MCRKVEKKTKSRGRHNTTTKQYGKDGKPSRHAVCGEDGRFHSVIKFFLVSNFCFGLLFDKGVVTTGLFGWHSYLGHLPR